ncbi:Cu-processing system ATP-binding protein [Alkalispirillum mobile]|uniref:Cu-processing system ATP-binding protein n=1 Tax=Alkalispirillum mobile TaxID=85925 RepID=A0A498C133_9GAMM|nr:ABC transporter ATP-binding protein [Alkalispirillum mobile]RLK48817.1 Cu-processing system ATP-binding protein [Alkalispirillum mobile]
MNAVVQLQSVDRHFGAVKALQGLDLELKEGEVLGLMGHNGAGKSTTMKLILGLIQPTAGAVRVFGHDPSGGDSAHLRERLGYLPENVSFYEQLSGREVLHYFARLKRVPVRRADELLEEVGLGHAVQRRVRTYSKGMRQRLGLAQALLGQPRLLLMDEPTVGLDPMATRDFYETVDRLRGQGVSIVLCSHVLPGIERHIDRAAILGGGRLLAEGTLDQLRHEAGLPQVIRVRTTDPQGVQRQAEGEGFSTRAVNGQSVELLTGDDRKLDALRGLLGGSHIRDLEWEPPTLEHLYVHFDKQLALREGQS